MTALDTRDAVEGYLAGDRIPCLLCGRAFRAVGHHVARAHGMTAKAYKTRFGLPAGQGVCAPDVRAAFAAVRHRTDTPERVQERVAALKEATRVSGAKPPFVARENGARMVAMRGRDRKLSEADYGHLLGRIRAGATITAACADMGLPGWTWLHAYIAADPARKAAFDAMWEDLPFSQQAASKKLGRRFAEAVAALRAQGLTCAQIGAQLSVSEEAVRRRIAREDT